MLHPSMAVTGSLWMPQPSLCLLSVDVETPREHARACVQFETLGTSLEPFPDALCGRNVAKPLYRSANQRIGEGRDVPPERA